MSGTVLATVVALLDPARVAERLAGLRLEWVAAALALSVLQVAASAWRWRFTAGRLGVAPPRRAALAEYYLATFLNQLLPGGVAGDVSRAWRHGRRGDRPGTDLRAVHAVVLERASGQAVMVAVAAASALLLVARGAGGLPLAAALGVAAAAGVLGARRLSRRLARLPVAGALLADARTALVAHGALAVQTVVSLLVVATYLATWVAATRAVGLDTPLPTLLPLVAPVLVTMLLPVTVAGWGVREAAAGALWGAVGLTAADGVAVSVAYGLLVLAGSLPGAAVLLVSVAGSRDRSRTADPAPGGSAAREAGAPRRASRFEGA